MNCEKCGKKIDNMLINVFNYDGSDNDYKYPITEYDENAVTVDVDNNWTGYELKEEEQKETIRCPYCKKFPFISKEIQVQNIVRIICFKGGLNND